MNIEKLKLNKKFYRMRVLDETKDAFKNVCGCEIKEIGNYFELVIKSKKDEKNLGLEFANYALSLMR